MKSKSLLLFLTPLLATVFLLTGCMEWNYGLEEDFDAADRGVFIVNEGNFQYGNSTLSYYEPETGKIENEVFYRANAMKLGDAAQSMTLRDSTGWIAVSNSHVVFAIDSRTFKEKGRITNLTSPRYIHFVSDEKAYVTQIWDNRIFIIDPGKYEITGHIVCPGMSPENGSTDQMIQYGKWLYVNCWSYDNRILKIDTETDEVVGELEVGIQPTSLALDRHGRLWTLTDGGYEGSPYGYEPPSLVCIDLESFAIEKKFTFRLGDQASEIKIDGNGEYLYWINRDIWKMSVDADHPPVRPFIKYSDTIYYGLDIDPVNGDIYVADAIDFQQQGMICRYDSEGREIGRFFAGIIPGSFCWKK